MPKFLNNIDLNKNELQNARIQNLGSAPSSPVAGQIYFHSSENILYYYNGSAWRPVAYYSFLNITDGTNTAVADDEADTFKIRSANNLLTAVVTNDDATHGDSVLFTVVQANIDHGTIAGLSDDDHTQYILAAGTRAFSGNQSLGGNKITSLGTPTSDTDAATKAYVDGVALGLDVKNSVRVATTANITLSGEQTIDGVAAVTGDRVLVKDQSTGANNGIYLVASGAWTRTTDADTSAEVTSGMFVFVSEGTTNADTGWVLTTNDAITLGSTALVFTQFTGAGSITAGAGLTKTGSTLDVGAGTGISVAADSVAIDTAVVVRKYAVDVGDNTSTSITVTHNLGTRDVIVAVRDNTTPYAWLVVDVEAATTNTVTLQFAAAPTTNQYRCIVHA